MASNLIGSEDTEFYNKAVNYWSEIPATVDGMLGGFGYISATDIQGSKTLLKQIFHMNDAPKRSYALDCGAGIGRIAKYLLSCYFDKIDMVEQNSTFLEQSKSYLGAENAKIGQQFPVGLQNFEPEPGKYDVIWNQWVLSHLTDEDLIEYLKKCQKGLNPNGVIVIKENITPTEVSEMDKKDSSVTRSMALFRHIFERAGLKVIKFMKQNNFPKGLFSVYMFVLRPKETLNQLNDGQKQSIDLKNKSSSSCEVIQETDSNSGNC